MSFWVHFGVDFGSNFVFGVQFLGSFVMLLGRPLGSILGPFWDFFGPKIIQKRIPKATPKEDGPWDAFWAENVQKRRPRLVKEIKLNFFEVARVDKCLSSDQ